MSSPEPQQLALSGAQVQPGHLDPCPLAVSPVVPRRLAQGRLESSFSVEAILARPETHKRVVTPPPLSTCTRLNLCSVSQYPVLPWVCSAATWLPTYLSLGVHPFCSMPCVPGLNVAHLFCQQGLSLTGTGMELMEVLGSGSRWHQRGILELARGDGVCL